MARFPRSASLYKAKVLLLCIPCVTNENFSSCTRNKSMLLLVPPISLPTAKFSAYRVSSISLVFILSKQCMVAVFYDSVTWESLAGGS